ncbi:MAG TPA: RNA polymerase sigma factor [Candidatus Acidoferrales bacterium]|nr:RNA polymerase sigma factor [Candidatus Acidoferrales bacterium]
MRFIPVSCPSAWWIFRCSGGHQPYRSRPRFRRYQQDPVCPGETVTIARREPSPDYLRKEVEQWFHELRQPLFRYLRILGCEHWQAEEISQEAFLRLLAARQDGLLIQDVRAWMFRVARNQWIDSRREHQRYWADQPADAGRSGRKHRDWRPDPEQELMRGEQNRRVSKEMSRLPELQRECVRLKAQGLRYREIASALGIPMTAAVDHVRRALARLRKTFRAGP